MFHKSPLHNQREGKRKRDRNQCIMHVLVRKTFLEPKGYVRLAYPFDSRNLNVLAV